MRIHKLTHPRLGPATWREMQAAVAAIKKDLNRRVCTWCHSEVPEGRRTRCGSFTCTKFLHQAQSWAYCATVRLRTHRFCPCGKHAVEVDHIVPVSLGGTSDQSNLRGLCHDCHRIATNRLRREKEKYKAQQQEHIMKYEGGLLDQRPAAGTIQPWHV